MYSPVDSEDVDFYSPPLVLSITQEASMYLTHCLYNTDRSISLSAAGLNTVWLACINYSGSCRLGPGD